ncbi:MAG: type III-B CRISPR-associated protein Cas10/Cmr2 [Candidatus Wallbacteria bacterium]|nr:type III-B CRISPR-associated protein Cas10/Cmr2 [Candidatus Wallbacteria bacterium]
MNELEHWRRKFALFFHDPFLKPYCFRKGNEAVLAGLRAAAEGGLEDMPCGEDRHKKREKKSSQMFIGHVLRTALVGQHTFYPPLEADLAATGADRPVLGPSQLLAIPFWSPGEDGPEPSSDRIATHPLCAAAVRPARERPVRSTRDLQSLAAEVLPVLARLALPADGWSNHVVLRQAWLRVWRLLPELLAEKGRCFWPLLPADTRCPDHSIWEHLRMSSSLGFLPPGQSPDERRQEGRTPRALRPWLLCLWVGPVSRYLQDSRSSRDLWTGSMVLSELAWALLRPIVNRFGPDAVTYPDLRHNARADVWLAASKAFDGFALRRWTRSALIPNRIFAIVPEGGAPTHFPAVRELAKQCAESASARWTELAASVFHWLSTRVGDGRWKEIWERQLRLPPLVRWTAVPWEFDGPVKDFSLPSELPFQDTFSTRPIDSGGNENAREARFLEWVGRAIWNHHQVARYTYFQTHQPYIEANRGYDYAMSHYKLLSLYHARRLQSDPSAVELELGEKCTLCGVNQALTNGPDGSVGPARQGARDFWKHPALDPDREGGERLCGPCSVRRFLTYTGESEFTRVSHSSAEPAQEPVSFPSTSVVAGQAFLCWVAESTLPTVEAARKKLVTSALAAGAPRTQRPEALPRLARLMALRPDATPFLSIDAQYTLPETWRSRRDQIQAAGAGSTAMAKNEDALQAVLDLHAIAKKHAVFFKTRVAIVSLDADRIGRLLLGDPEQVGARWRDVLHPKAVERILSDRPPAEWWKSLVDRPRLMGPSLHAFISTALAAFANDVVPWVAEREFGAKLIYAGGDDALILCPASEALPLVRRLNDLFSAAWIVDSLPGRSTWVEAEDEKPDHMAPGSPQARLRYGVLETSADGSPVDLQLWQQCRPHVTGEQVRWSGVPASNGVRLLPMLGAHQSLSAGIAYGHFKTHMQRLRSESSESLQEAKALGGDSVGLSWATRNGAKLHFTLPLRKGSASPESCKPPQGGQPPPPRFVDAADYQRLLELFAKPGELARGLPYKLRDHLHRLAAAASREQPPWFLPRTELLQGLCRRALQVENESAASLAELLAGVWSQAWTTVVSRAGLSGPPNSRALLEVIDGSLDGLLLARAIASEDADDQH